MAFESGKVIVSDLAWCWWTRPRAVRLGNDAWSAGLDTNGGIIAARLAQFEDDDHNNPALVVDENRPLVCFYSRHDAEEGMRFRVSKRPLDLTEWEEERVLPFSGSTTYAQVHVLATNCTSSPGSTGRAGPGSVHLTGIRPGANRAISSASTPTG